MPAGLDWLETEKSIKCLQGSGVQFATRFPAELEGKIDRSHSDCTTTIIVIVVIISIVIMVFVYRSLFDYTISTLNSLYAEAEKGSCST